MISLRFYCSFYFNYSILLFSLFLSFIISSASCKCADGHQKPILFLKSNRDSSSQMQRMNSDRPLKTGFSEEKKINLFHRPIKSSVMVDERTYRLVEDAPGTAEPSNSSDGDASQGNDKKSADANRTVEMRSVEGKNQTVYRRDADNSTIFIQDNRLIEESNEQSSSIDLPEDILIKMSTMNQKEFFDSYVEEEPQDDSNIVYGHLEDDEQETHRQDEVSVSMLMRGSNTDSEGEFKLTGLTKLALGGDISSEC